MVTTKNNVYTATWSTTTAKTIKIKSEKLFKSWVTTLLISKFWLQRRTRIIKLLYLHPPRHHLHQKVFWQLPFGSFISLFRTMKDSTLTTWAGRKLHSKSQCSNQDFNILHKTDKGHESMFEPLTSILCYISFTIKLSLFIVGKKVKKKICHMFYVYIWWYNIPNVFKQRLISTTL